MQHLDLHTVRHILSYDYYKMNRLVCQDWKDTIDKCHYSVPPHQISPVAFGKNTKKINWLVIAKCMKLSPEFMAQFADHLDWKTISRYQVLSPESIAQFADRIHWEIVCRLR